MRLLYTLLTILTMGIASAQYYVVPSLEANEERFSVFMRPHEPTGGFLLDLNNEEFVAIDDAILDDIRQPSLTSTITTFDIAINANVPISEIVSNTLFSWDCGIVSSNGVVPSGEQDLRDCGGGTIGIDPLRELQFSFLRSGIYVFDWFIDEDERQTTIAVYNDGTVVFHL